MPMPDIDLEVDEEEENDPPMETQEQEPTAMDQIRQALERYAVVPKLKNTSGLSSDYWKGLVVGLFLCQAVFVPFWAAAAVSSGASSGNGLLDTLVGMGLVPEEQAMGARMMMGLFARPGDGEDTLVSTIEVKEDGSILANGQRIQ